MFSPTYVFSSNNLYMFPYFYLRVFIIFFDFIDYDVPLGQSAMSHIHHLLIINTY